MIDLKNKIKEYFIITLFLWMFYTIGLTPLALPFWFNWNIDAYLIWMFTGLPANFVLNYPIGKGLIRFNRWYFRK